MLDLFGDDERIQHFLKLHYAIRVLVSSNERTHNDIENAKMILESFITNSISVYGRNFLSYNVHNLINLTDDVKTGYRFSIIGTYTKLHVLFSNVIIFHSPIYVHFRRQQGQF